MLLFIRKEQEGVPFYTIFQYISCYCLSHHPSRCSRMYNHFNTSHVTVYLFGTILAPFYLHYFNTSHVTVYPISIRYSRNFSFISIHLMLLFIIFSISLRSVRLQFQYISCYCLSRKCGVCDSLDFPISIHLMLLFIRFGRCLASCGK